MAISATVSPDGGVITIGVEGRFDFSVHNEFRHAYADVQPKPRRVVVDLSRTEYMDSSALGMLLLLKQDAGGDGADVTLARAKPNVAKILNVANFQKLFKIA